MGVLIRGSAWFWFLPFYSLNSCSSLRIPSKRAKHTDQYLCKVHQLISAAPCRAIVPDRRGRPWHRLRIGGVTTCSNARIFPNQPSRPEFSKNGKPRHAQGVTSAIITLFFSALMWIVYGGAIRANLLRDIIFFLIDTMRTKSAVRLLYHDFLSERHPLTKIGTVSHFLAAYASGYVCAFMILVCHIVDAKAAEGTLWRAADPQSRFINGLYSSEPTKQSLRLL